MDVTAVAVEFFEAVLDEVELLSESAIEASQREISWNLQSLCEGHTDGDLQMVKPAALQVSTKADSAALR